MVPKTPNSVLLSRDKAVGLQPTENEDQYNILQRYRHGRPWGCHMRLSWESPATELSQEADRHHQEGLLSYTGWPADLDYTGINSALYSEYSHWSDPDYSLLPLNTLCFSLPMGI